MKPLLSLTCDDHGRPDAAAVAVVAGAIGPVLDAHHHLWDLDANSYPWLQEKPVQAHFGDYSRIRKTYLASDYRRDVGIVQLAGSVHVEAHWRDGIAPQDETAWLSAHSDSQGLPDAIIGAAEAMSPDLDDVLNAHQAFARFRGIRIMAYGRGKPEGALRYRDECFRTGLARMVERDLIIELQAPPTAHGAVCELADLHPSARFVIIHCGLPIDRSGAGLATWREGIAMMARHENVSMKLSGLPMTDHKWDVSSFKPMVRHLLDNFGTYRLMFGSNFPVDGLFSDYPTLLAGYVAAIGVRDIAPLRRIFRETSSAFYRTVETSGNGVEATND